jgi:hypothetical protein
MAYSGSTILAHGGRRSLALVVLALVVLVAPAAHAHTVAPMCDPSAASMPAPIPAPPSNTGDLVAPKSCEDFDGSLFDASRPGHDSQAPELRSSAPDRALPTGISWGVPPATVLACPASVQAPHLPGFPQPVYRPPCR